MSFPLESCYVKRKALSQHEIWPVMFYCNFVATQLLHSWVSHLPRFPDSCYLHLYCMRISENPLTRWTSSWSSRAIRLKEKVWSDYNRPPSLQRPLVNANRRWRRALVRISLYQLKIIPDSICTLHDPMYMSRSHVCFTKPNLVVSSFVPVLTS